MNKHPRLPRLQLTRTSMRPLTHDLAAASGGRPRLVSYAIGGSRCDPMCVETSETTTTTILASVVHC